MYTRRSTDESLSVSGISCLHLGLGGGWGLRTFLGNYLFFFLYFDFYQILFTLMHMMDLNIFTVVNFCKMYYSILVFSCLMKFEVDVINVDIDSDILGCK